MLINSALYFVPGDWQLELLLWLQSVRHPVLTFIMGALTMLGDDLFYVAVLSLMYWTGSRNGPRDNSRSQRDARCRGGNLNRQDVFTLMRLVVFSVLVNVVIKNVIDAPRPFEAVAAIEGLWTFTAESASFPSGHAQTAATFWLALALADAEGRRGRGGGAATIGMACAIVFLIALSRLYLGVHWPQDVLAGGLIGGVLGLLGPALLKRFSRWYPIATLALSAIGIFVFRDHSAVQLTSLLIGASIGHAQMQALLGSKAGDVPEPAAKPALLLLGILAVAAAYGTTTWLLTFLGLPEIIVDAVATLETGLMVTWGVPALLAAKSSGTLRV